MDLGRAVDQLDNYADIELAIGKVDKRGPRVHEIPDMKERQQRYHADAYAHFARARGAYDRIEQGEDPADVHRETWNQFQAFKGMYDGATRESYEARRQYKQRLAGNFAALMALDNEVYIDRVVRSERKTPYPKYLGEGKDDERELTLDTQGKLIGLRDDRRARFLPTTHREKNLAIELLDYLDNPEYPKGVHDRLSQIYARQVNVPLQKVNAAKKEAQERGELYTGKSPEAAWAEGHEIAQDTIRSILHEWGDYVANARYSLHELGAISELIDDTDKPTLTLKEVLAEAGSLAPDVRPLLRFMILEAFREKGELPDPIFDPLRTRVIRSADLPGKNKLMTDVFLLPADQEHIGEYLTKLEATITVGELRTKKIMKDVVLDSQRRFSFFRDMLGRIPETSNYYQYAQEAIRIAA